jgi:hypothetical protein
MEMCSLCCRKKWFLSKKLLCQVVILTVLWKWTVQLIISLTPVYSSLKEMKEMDKINCFKSVLDVKHGREYVKGCTKFWNYWISLIV